MKIKFLLFCAITMLFTFTGSIFAQNSNSNVQEKMTADQVQQAKKVLEQMVDPKQQTTGTNNSNDKTMADVLDKGIDLFAGYVTSVSDMLKTIAPDVWRVMIRQQYAKAIAGPTTPLLFLIMVFIFHKIGKKWFKLKPEDDLFDFSDDYNTGRAWFVGIVPGVASVVVGIWFIIMIGNSIQIIVNPEYYALKDLISMILGKQGM